MPGSSDFILTIIGTRPEAIKMAPVIRELSNKNLNTSLLVTGQHRSLIDPILKDLDLKPDFDLDLMRENQQVQDVLATGIQKITEVIVETKPALTLVHGDTTSSLAGAISSFYSRVPFGHVEAGLRSGDFQRPFPEEGNRKIIDSIADLLWPPTPKARENLDKEGLSDRCYQTTGNTAIDSIIHSQKIIKEKNRKIEKLASSFESKKLILFTSHRRESFGPTFLGILEALKVVAKENYDWKIVFPIHPNPSIRKPARRILKEIPNIHLIDPLPYLEFVSLIDACSFIVTDSGGLQEEGPALNKPVLVLRDTTERQEGVESGCLSLIGTKKETIVSRISELIHSTEKRKKMANSTNPFGDGKASTRIVEDIQKHLKSRPK